MPSPRERISRKFVRFFHRDASALLPIAPHRNQLNGVPEALAIRPLAHDSARLRVATASCVSALLPPPVHDFEESALPPLSPSTQPPPHPPDYPGASFDMPAPVRLKEVPTMTEILKHSKGWPRGLSGHPGLDRDTRAEPNARYRRYP